MPAKIEPAIQPAQIDEKIGVLVANLGTPDATDYWAVRRYLSEFLSDTRVVDRSPWVWQPILQGIILTVRPFKSGAAYRSIWNTEKDESPLLTITRDQSEALSNTLKSTLGDSVEVDFCMRYGNPSTASKVRLLIDKGCRRILFFPLYPQYSAATTATANDKFFDALALEKRQPAVRTVPAYFDNAGYIDALAQSVERQYEDMGTQPEILLVSYHGLPKRHVAQGDPYYDQCLENTRLLKERLGWGDDKITTAFQSRFGPEEWLQPYASEEVVRIAKSGVKSIAVIAPAFSADCIETLEEIKEEICEGFKSAGGETFTYIPCLNDDEAHISALAEIIRSNLSGWV